MNPNYCVGIDISADTFVSSIFIAPEAPVQTSEAFSNTPEGFAELEKWLSDHQVTPDNSIVCLEATGVYGEMFCYWLVSKGYRLAVEPPHTVKRAFKSKGHKNDKVDSRQIAEYAYRYPDKLHFWHPRSEIIEQIAVLLTTREQFVQQKTASTNARKALKRKVVQTPLANQLFDEHVKNLHENITTLEKEIKELISRDPDFRNMVTWLISIPSVGLLLAANTLVVTNGFVQQDNIDYREIAAHIGICPYQHRSGTSVYVPDRAFKLGPARMRKLLYLAARSLRTHHPEFRSYFERKRAEGKDSRLILNNISNKLVKIMCAIIKSQKPYIKGYVSVNPLFLKKT